MYGRIVRRKWANISDEHISGVWGGTTLFCGRFGRRQQRRMPSGILQRAALITIGVSQNIAAIFRVIWLSVPSSQRGYASRRTVKRTSCNGTSTVCPSVTVDTLLMAHCFVHYFLTNHPLEWYYVGPKESFHGGNSDECLLGHYTLRL
jgi:hypothetical protein